MAESVVNNAHMLMNWSMFGISIVSNILLVMLVKNVKVAAMGSYEILIYTTAIMDVFIALINAIVVPNIHMGTYSFVVFGLGTHDWPAFQGLISIYVFDLLFYQTFCLLSFHFVYRYVVLLAGLRPSHILARLSILHWTVLGLISEVLFNMIMTFLINHYEPRTDWLPDNQLMEDMMEYYGIDMRKPFGHFHVVYGTVDDDELTWNLPIVIYTLSILGFIAALGAIMIFCAYAVLAMMNQLSGVSTIKTNTHRQFFRALVLQTMFPIIMSFTPVGMLVLLPLSGQRFGALGNYLMALATIYPAIDPILLIICVQSYRRKLRNWFNCCLPPSMRKITNTTTITLVSGRVPSIIPEKSRIR